ncbi:MAG TPA: protein kinase [Kofleriaceae bacterium]|nr:protein kinase [Kofleriaceae bacterium]
MVTMNALAAGARLGDYVLEHELEAKPGLVAWSANHSLLPRRAKISTVHPAFAGNLSVAAQLTREACILEVLRHGGAPRVFECSELPDRRPWVASELIEGPRLSVLLAEEGALGVSRVLALLAGLAEILHYAHTRGLVHRNLRPGAIASRAEGPCIVDWDDARSRDSDGLLPVPLDWLAYQSPEVSGGEPADSRADVYSLGVIAHEALIGAWPASSARRPPVAPPRLLTLLGRMVAHDPLVRPTSAEVRAEALAIVEQTEVLLAPADDDGADVQVEEVELGLALAAELDSEPLPPTPAGSQTWRAEEVEARERPKTPPPKVALDPVFEPARTKTESMQPDYLARTKTEPMTAEHLAAVRTEPLPAEPESRAPRSAARIVKHSPTRVLASTSTKPH